MCTAERARGYKPDGTLFRYLMAHSGVSRDEILHVGQSQFTDLVGGKPLGLTIAWINRRGVDLHPSVPRPDFIFADIASLIPLLDGRAIRNGGPKEATGSLPQRRTSAFGTKRTSGRAQSMSAFGGKADITRMRSGKLSQPTLSHTSFKGSSS